MRRLSIPLALVFSLTLLLSCTTYRLHPLPSKDQGDVQVQASAVWAPEIQFTVQVSNRSAAPVTVDGDQFRLYVGDNEGTNPVWTPVVLYKSSEYYQKEEAEARSRPTISITSTDGAYRRTTSTTTIVGSGGSVTVVRTRPVLEPVETRTITLVPGPNDRRLEWLQQNLFYSVVLQPGLDYSGLVYGRIAKGTHYKLVVPVAGRDHEIVFQRVKESLFINLD